MVIGFETISKESSSLSQNLIQSILSINYIIISLPWPFKLLCFFFTGSVTVLPRFFSVLAKRWIRNLFWKQEMELTLVGLQNAGKSTLVSVFATGAFTEDMIPTVGFNMRKVTKGNVSIKLWDLGGQPAACVRAFLYNT
jgi:hypothetical protein